MTLGKLVRRQLKRLNKTQKDLALDTGFSKEHVWKIAADKYSSLSVNSLNELSVELNVPLETLLKALDNTRKHNEKLGQSSEIDGK